MAYEEYIQQLREATEGDAYFQLLQSKLEAGHTIQSVSVAEFIVGPPTSATYRFLLARLGTLSTVDAPSQPAVERLLSTRQIRMASREDEEKRCEIRLRSTLEFPTEAVELATARDVFRRIAETTAAPRVASAVRASWSERRWTESSAVLSDAVQTTFNAEIVRLVQDASYSWEEAASIAEGGLAAFVRSI